LKDSSLPPPPPLPRNEIQLYTIHTSNRDSGLFIGQVDSLVCSIFCRITMASSEGSSDSLKSLPAAASSQCTPTGYRKEVRASV
jgi:hypothetical protein